MKNLNTKEKAVKILNLGYVCDHCLGRQFAQLLTGHTNKERGEIVRFFIALCLDSEEEIEVKDVNFKGFSFQKYEPENAGEEVCIVCNNFFQGQVEYFVEKAKEELKELEFENFLVGTKLTPELVRNEEELWEKIGIEGCEPIKPEINREVGKRLEKEIEKEVEFKKPEINAILNLKTQAVEIEINSICFYGEYNKLVRGIPQTKWPSGKYKTSIEEIIAEPFMEITKGSGHKFHGAGREDIDALCKAKRPFIFEILEPKKRNVDLSKIRKKVNKSGKVKIFNLKNISSDWIEKLKGWRPDKTYQVLIKTKDEVSDEDLKKLDNLIGEIHQETPNRVLHRRADKLRKREIKNIKWKRKSKKKIQLVIKAEAGTYIKELITGDKNRTYPSVKEMLRTECEPKDLIVKTIHIDKKKKP